MTNYNKLVLAIALVLIGPALNYSGKVFAEDQDSSYSHQRITAIWQSGMVCGDHNCAPGEFPQYPTPVIPVRVH